LKEADCRRGIYRFVVSPHLVAKAVMIFENGFRATLDKSDKVIDAIAPSASVYAYNRPGYDHSLVVETTRDGMTIVEELRRNLK
jgi:hypothetical protein